MSSPSVPLRKVEVETTPERTVAELAMAGVRGWAVAAPGVAHADGAMVSPIRTAGPRAEHGITGWTSRPTKICRPGEGYWAPRFGMVVGPDGDVGRPTIGGPWTDPARLAKAPGLTPEGEGYRFAPPDEVAKIAAAGVFMPWGGVFNYGHFVVDGLAGLQALAASGLDRAFPPHTPRLTPWQRELVGYVRDAPVVEVEAPLAHVGEALFPDSMDHYLHAPNGLVLEVRDRVLAHARPTVRPLPRRVYFSRRGFTHTMRIMLNEARLERALARRGFAIVHAEHLSPRRQVALMREAEVVVGPSGAAMANALFAPPSARIVDIQPEVFASIWVCALGELVGQQSYAYRVAAPAPLEDVPWFRRARGGFRFAYETPLDTFLPWLDALL